MEFAVGKTFQTKALTCSPESASLNAPSSSESLSVLLDGGTIPRRTLERGLLIEGRFDVPDAIRDRILAHDDVRAWVTKQQASSHGPLAIANTQQRLLLERERRQRLLLKNGSVKMCANCGTTSTPSWRRCSEGKTLLCNACGLYQKLHNKSRPFVITDDGMVKVQRSGSGDALVCSNCSTSNTPLWRRGLQRECLCNACGLYLKQHQKYRTLKSTAGAGRPECSNVNRSNDGGSSGVTSHTKFAPLSAATAIDLNALELLANELCAAKSKSTLLRPAASTVTSFGTNSTDEELMEKLQSLESAASLLLSACEKGPGVAASPKL